MHRQRRHCRWLAFWAHSNQRPIPPRRESPHSAKACRKRGSSKGETISLPCGLPKEILIACLSSQGNWVRSIHVSSSHLLVVGGLTRFVYLFQSYRWFLPSLPRTLSRSVGYKARTLAG